MIELLLTNVTDKPTRSALETLRDGHNQQDILKGSFKLISASTSGAVTNLTLTHGLGFVPLDILVTRLSGGTVTWNYDLFTKDTVSLTTSAAVSLRFLAGRIE